MKRMWRAVRILCKWNWRKLTRRLMSSALLAPLWENKWKIILSVFMAAALTGAGSYLVKSKRPTMTLTLKYANASKGLNPNGTRFNMFEICSDEVLERAVELGELDIDADYLAGRIDVYAKISNNASKKVSSAASSGNNLKYIADEYSISYSQKNKLTSNQADEVLRAVAMAYTEYFKKHYSEKNDLLSEALPDLSEYEYVEIERIFRDKAIGLERYFQSRYDENSDFISEDGSSYQDLYTMVNNFRTISLESYRGFVQKYGLAKASETYIEKLDYANRMLTIEKDKHNNAYDFRIQAVSQYDARITGVMLVPSIDTANEFYMNRTKTGIDYLTEDAYSAALKANTVQDEINQNTAIIQNIRQNRLTGKRYEEVKQSADKMIQQLQEQLDGLCQKAKNVDDEYLEYKAKDYLSFRFPQTNLMSYINKKLLLLIGMIVFLLLSVYFHVKAYLNRLVVRQKQEEEALAEKEEVKK